jgi:hypothetical protein
VPAGPVGRSHELASAPLLLSLSKKCTVPCEVPTAKPSGAITPCVRYGECASDLGNWFWPQPYVTFLRHLRPSSFPHRLRPWSPFSRPLSIQRQCKLGALACRKTG